MPRIVRVLPWLPTAFRMAMNVVLGGEDRGLACRVRMDVKDPRFLVVDPDDGMSHGVILLQINRGTEGGAATWSAFSVRLRLHGPLRASGNRASRAAPRAVAPRSARRRQCTCRTCRRPGGRARHAPAAARRHRVRLE